MLERLEKLEEEQLKARLGGGEKRIERHHSRGRLMPRERIELLLDREVLRREDEHGVFPERRLDRRLVRIAKRAREVDVADLGGEAFRYRSDRHCHRHIIPAA